MADLQLEWDTLLVQSWYSYGYDEYLLLLCLNFERLHGVLPWDAGIKRAPINGQVNMTTRVFICGYLKKIATFLWDCKDREKALRVIHASKIDTALDPLEKRKRQDHRNNTNRLNKLFDAALKVKRESNADWESYKLSNQWGVCK